MSQESLCPNCNQTVENGAIYCGNCGVKLAQASPVPASSVEQDYSNGPSPNPSPINPTTAASAPNSIPSYAVPVNHYKQHWAAMAVAFGFLGTCGAILTPILGMVFGVAGIVLATSSYHISHGWLRTISLIAPILALLVSVGFWVSYDASHLNQMSKSTNRTGTSNGISTLSVTTPCYTLSFSTQLNVNNNSGSCTVNAYNGSTFDDSTDIFKVVAQATRTVNAVNFDSVAKSAIEADIAKNLSGFNSTNQASTIFDGSPAYYIQSHNSSSNVAVIEEAIFHQTTSSNKDNFFSIVHAVSGSSTNLSSIQKSWQWND